MSRIYHRNFKEKKPSTSLGANLQREGHPLLEAPGQLRPQERLGQWGQLRNALRLDGNGRPVESDLQLAQLQVPAEFALPGAQPNVGHAVGRGHQDLAVAPCAPLTDECQDPG